ncbi:STX6 [Symbiodinium sp. CCMP2456]|nr:STX6 [Symbiodinium sp. CCMP2456]
MLSLDDCVLLLTKKHGTLKAAFDKLDFFQDGRLSCLEWQEGLRQLLSTGSKESRRFDPLRDPRRTCDSVLLRLFKAMDKDKDGFISLDDLANAKGGPFVYARELRHKDTEEKLPVSPKGSKGSPRFFQELSYNSSSMNFTLLPSVSRKKDGKEHFAGHIYSEMRAFAALLIKKFDTLDKAVLRPSGDEITTFGAEAYKHFDGNRNNQLGMTEFELDRNNNGNISIQEFKVLRALNATEEKLKNVNTDAGQLGPGENVLDLCKDEAVTSKTRREQVDESVARAQLCKMASQWLWAVIERKQRSPIQAPRRHQRSVCLASTHVQFPEAEHVSSSAGFYSFPRACTGRADLQLHPDEIPGFDSENFTKERGPGYCKRGPESFTEVMPDAHPLRGNKFKVGSTVPRAERFGPAIPSVEGRKDMEHSAATFATYEGRMPRMSWKVDGTGAQIFLSKKERVGLTTGLSDSFRLLKPAPWDKSRTLLKLKSHSESILKCKDC